MNSEKELGLRVHQQEEENAVAARKADGDACIWSKLPPDLLVKASFLSVPTLFRCRAVCKAWNNLISSSEFAALCAQAPLQKSHVILVGLPGLTSLWLAYMFDARANKWCHPIDLKFLQSYWELAFGDATKGLIRRRVLAACGSMICISSTYVKGSEVLVACNPVRKTFQELPLKLALQVVAMWPYGIQVKKVYPSLRAQSDIVPGDSPSAFSPAGVVMLEEFRPQPTEVTKQAPGQWRPFPALEDTAVKKLAVHVCRTKWSTATSLDV